MSEEGSGAKDIGRREFIRKLAYGAGALLGASAGFNIRKAQRDAESEEEMLLRKSSSQAPATVPNPQSSEAPINPAPEVEELSINSKFEPLYDTVNSYINIEEQPEFWKRLEKVLSYDTQEIYDFMEVNPKKDKNGDAKEVGYHYFPSGYREGMLPGLSVSLLRDNKSIEVQISLRVDEVGGISENEKGSLDSLGLEELRVKKARALLGRKDIEDLQWDNLRTFDRSAVDPLTNISHRQIIDPANGIATYLLKIPEESGYAPKLIIPEPKIPRPDLPKINI